jgi:hypothetical protein
MDTDALEQLLLRVAQLAEDFGEVVAAAMIDRLVHHAEVVSLRGDSYRLKRPRWVAGGLGGRSTKPLAGIWPPRSPIWRGR